eukprot:scaffold7.g3734.t1
MCDALCRLADLDCDLAVISYLADVVPAVVNGTVDLVLHSLSVTPERSRLVEFVHPYFYSAGVALYALRTTGDVLAAGGGWGALEGERVCVVDGYYAAGALVKAYGIGPVAVPDTAAAAAAVQAGACDAYAYDSGLPLRADMPQAAGVAPVLTAPYGIPVQRGNAELWDRLSAALVRLMMVRWGRGVRTGL